MIPLVTIDIAAEKIGTLPSLEPRPNHSNVRALERTLYDRLEAIPSPQSPEWGFRGLAEQPLEYGLKSQTPWQNANDPGEHRLADGTLTIRDQSDADAIFAAEARAFQSQSNVQTAIIAALNQAVPKRFKRSDTVGAQNYKNNQNPRDIIAALRDSYGRPTPAEKEANETAFNTEWNPIDPIEAFFDRLEDCFITAFIAKPPFTKPQLIDKAIRAIQRTGLYNSALISWNAKPEANQIWENLKIHFIEAYTIHLTSGAGTTTTTGYHTAYNTHGQIHPDDDDVTIQTLESALTNGLSTIQLANTASHQTTNDNINALRQELVQMQQQLALYTRSPPGPPTAPAPWQPAPATTRNIPPAAAYTTLVNPTPRTTQYPTAFAPSQYNAYGCGGTGRRPMRGGRSG